MCTYDKIESIKKEYIESIKKEFLPKERWDEIHTDRGDYTLVIGAGVTACVVGDWNQLLNEVAVSRIVDDNKKEKDKADSIQSVEVRDFIKRKLDGGNFLPKTTDVLEKGDYLQFDPEDHVDVFGANEVNPNQLREKVFAQRVWFAIRHLMDEQLKGRDYVSDYVDWLKDEKISPFSLNRKKMSNGKDIAKEISDKSNYELIHGINDWLGQMKKNKLNEKEIRRTLRLSDKDKKRFASKDKKRFASLRSIVPSAVSDEALKEAVSTKGVSIALHKLLVNTAKEIMRLPDYCTLDALIDLSLKGTFQSIITYNFDTVFDRLLANEDVQKWYKKYAKVEIYGIHSSKPNQLGCDKRPIKIYHVHGILDTPRPSEASFMNEVEPIIFSGNAYESYQRHRFNYGSMKIASARLEGNLLCVGFSGSDANFRSIVREFMHMPSDVFSSESEKHRVFLTRGLENDCRDFKLEKGKDKEMSAADLKASYSCLRSYMAMLKEYFEKKIKVRIIWEDNFASMADELKKLKPPVTPSP